MAITYQQLKKARVKRGIDNPPLNPANVRKEKCKSCPFGDYGDAIGSEYDRKTFNQQQVILSKQAMEKSNQYCHADELKGEVSTHVCRGARDISLRYFYALGYIEAPTDEAYLKKLKECGLVK